MSLGYVAVAAVVVSAATTALSVQQQKKANVERQKADAIAQRQEQVRATRERAQALRQNRLQQAEVFAAAANQGAMGSSSVQGATAALGTQTAANIGFANQIDSLGAMRQQSLELANKFNNRASTIQQVGGTISNGIASVGGAFK